MTSAPETAGTRRRGRTRKAADRRAAEQRRQRRRIILGVALIAIVVAVLAGGRWLWATTQEAITEYEVTQPGMPVPDLGNLHIQPGTRSPIPYNSDPPTSGPHYGALASWGVHTKPIARELQVHNLEDGGVLIQYRCEDGCPELVEQLRAAAQPYLSSPRGHVILAPYPTMSRRMALTAWGRIAAFDEFDAERVRRFIERYRCFDWHEGRKGRRIPNC